MAILSDYEEEDHKKPTTSAPPARKPFTAALYPSDPLGFLEKVFEFVARESDLFKSDSLMNDINAVVRMVKDKVETEDKRRKDVKIEGNGKAEKKIKEEVAAAAPVKKEEARKAPVKKEEAKKAPVKKEELKEEVKDSESKVEEKKDGRRAPNKGNGLDMDNYSWGQSIQEVTITVPVPPGTKSRAIACEIKKNRISVGLKGQPPILDGELFRPIKVDDCFWSLEDQKSISILLTKQDQMEWWKYIVKGEPQIDTQQVEPESSRLGDLDPETRSTVEKMMFDQRQKQRGLPTSDEMQKQELMKKFMAEHPEMDFSRAKMV
ncbi:protein bobber 1 [Phtheirospermum japonicum]|uniref:Protein bobber 1 n=1 Tax=Phtheirospermum japonicum TaxID=374723 RepID=A0A830BV01_9LAMI|nr:protein bobber 1 [Phtheirospermum japonicum]